MAKYKPMRIGDTHPEQQINPATEEIDGRIYVSQTGVVLGRSSAGDGGHEEIPFADIPGGGAASIVEITYDDMQTAIADSTLTPGQYYNITDAAGTDLGFVCLAVKTNEITVSGTGGYLNADFHAVGDYSGVEAITGQAAGIQHGIWKAENEGGYAQGDIVVWNLKHWQLTDSGAIDGTEPRNTPASIIYHDQSGLLTLGETITGNLGATGVIIFDNQDGTMHIDTITGDWSAESTFSGNSSGVTATIDTFTPADISAAYTELLRTDESQGYIAVWDETDYVFQSSAIRARRDGRNSLSGGCNYSTFPWGNQNITSNVLIDSSAFIQNFIGTLSNCTLIANSSIENIVGLFFIDSVFMVTAIIRNLTSNGISTISSINLLQQVALDSLIFETNGTLAYNTLYASAYMYGITFGENCLAQNNIIDNGGSIEGITIGANSSISRNKIGPGAILGGDMVLGNGTEMEDNILENGAQLTGITAGASCLISRNKIGQRARLGLGITLGDNTRVLDNIIEGNGILQAIISDTNARISTNKIGPVCAISGITLGSGAGIEGNTLQNVSSISGCTIGSGSRISKNTLYANASIKSINSDGTVIAEYNILENGAQLTGITAGASCLISRNKVGQGARMGGSEAASNITTMLDNALFDDNEIGSSGIIAPMLIGENSVCLGNKIRSQSAIGDNVSIGNNSYLSSLIISGDGYFDFKTISDNIVFGSISLDVTMSEPDTIIDSAEVKIARKGYSDFPAFVDITGLTTVNITAAFAQYVGIFNLTSSNATESIDQIDNPPTLFPFQIRPAAGLVLTVTGTAYSGIAAGQIALTTTDVTLDGDKGEFIELEIDPLGSGALIERRRVAGLL